MCEPIPTRLICALVCRNWARACREDNLLVRVLPVDSPTPTQTHGDQQPMLLAHHCKSSRPPCKRHISLSCALKSVLPGETLILGPGRYWESSSLLVDSKIRVVGDLNMPERVLIDLNNALEWRGRSGALIGITLHRLQSRGITNSALVVKGGHLVCHRVVVDSSGAPGAAISLHQGLSPGACPFVCCNREYFNKSRRKFARQLLHCGECYCRWGLRLSWCQGYIVTL